MVDYAKLQADRRKFEALTGLTPWEFHRLLPAFQSAYAELYPADQTLAGRRRQRSAGGGRKGALHPPEQKLLFILIYLEAYPLQVVMAELFGLSQPGVNYWLQRLLPVLGDALDDLGVMPERDPRWFAAAQRPATPHPRPHHRWHRATPPEAQKP